MNLIICLSIFLFILLSCQSDVSSETSQVDPVHLFESKRCGDSIILEWTKYDNNNFFKYEVFRSDPSLMESGKIMTRGYPYMMIKHPSANKIISMSQELFNGNRGLDVIEI